MIQLVESNFRHVKVCFSYFHPQVPYSIQPVINSIFLLFLFGTIQFFFLNYSNIKNSSYFQLFIPLSSILINQRENMDEDMVKFIIMRLYDDKIFIKVSQLFQLFSLFIHTIIHYRMKASQLPRLISRAATLPFPIQRVPRNVCCLNYLRYHFNSCEKLLLSLSFGLFLLLDEYIDMHVEL